MTTVADILAEWKADRFGIPICRGEGLAIPLESYAFADAGAWCKIDGSFAGNCRLMLPPGTEPLATKVSIRKLSPAVQHDICIVLLKPLPGLMIGIGGPTARIFIGRPGYHLRLHINTWRSPLVCVGDEVTSNGTTLIADDADVVIGRDCMLSDDILLQSHAQHGIIDLASMRIVNDQRQAMLLGEHVWVGRRAMLMPNIRVGDGSIISAGAVVTHDVGRQVVAAGVPAREVRRNATWCRDPTQIDKGARDYLAAAEPAA